MSEFSLWLLSIVGIILLEVLIDVILPDGSTNKYIKAIFSFVVILVIVAPLTKIDSIRFAFDKLGNDNSIILNDEYIYKFNNKLIENYKMLIIENAKNRGIENIDVEIVSEIDNYSLKVNQVNILLFNVVINEKIEHIDKYQILCDIVKTYLKVDKESIFFYE